MRRLFLPGFALLVVSLLGVAGCHSNNSSTSPDTTVYPSKTFQVKGKVISTDATHVMLEHGAVPGFMEAMTMSYKLKDPNVVSELHPGDLITATIVVEQDAAGFKNPQLDHIVVIGQAKPDYKPTVQYHVPTPGDIVPDFALVNENGKTIHFGQFKGRVLLATFIFTRCQMADFCPRMNSNFAEINKVLAADQAAYAKTHLLSISFDPKYDTPAVLKQYGTGYAEQESKKGFAHWDFAAPPEKELAAVEQFFNVGVTGEGVDTMHSLSTVLIGKDGKVVAWYPTNDWKPSDVLTAMRAAA